MRFRQEFALRVKLGRVRRGWSQQTAADEASITRSTWAKIEKGKPVHDENLRAALQALGLDEDDVGADDLNERVAELERLIAGLSQSDVPPPDPTSEQETA